MYRLCCMQQSWVLTRLFMWFCMKFHDKSSKTPGFSLVVSLSMKWIVRLSYAWGLSLYLTYFLSHTCMTLMTSSLIKVCGHNDTVSSCGRANPCRHASATEVSCGRRQTWHCTQSHYTDTGPAVHIILLLLNLSLCWGPNKDQISNVWYQSAGVWFQDLLTLWGR